MFRLHKKDLQISSLGKVGKGRQSFANFPDYFKKVSISEAVLEHYIRDFFEIVQKAD